jgi:DNA-binding HxlR family transcriptional regulator
MVMKYPFDVDDIPSSIVLLKRKYARFCSCQKFGEPMSSSAQSLAPNVMSAACPSRQILNHILSRWGLLILVALGSGTLRFGALRRRVDGISERMLAQSLQTLERDGFVDRNAFDIVPPHVEYRLTPLGQEITEQATELVDWIEENLHRIPDAAFQ